MSLQDIYKNAGVVMKPAAMKNGKLYSQQPHSGAGDFNFSRADGVQTRINKHGLIETVANNEPRLSYDIVDGKVSDCPHLLLEPSRTNVIQRSQEFDDAYWSKSRIETPTKGGVIDPLGGLDAYTLEMSTSQTAGGGVYRTGISVSGNNSFSVFAKKGNIDYLVLGDGGLDGSKNAVYFNLSNGTVGTEYQNAVGEMRDFSNGWYRCTMRYNESSSNPKFIYVTDVDGQTANSVQGGDYIHIWGAQLEAGSYPTSYIPTSGSTEARQADACNGSGNSETFNDSEGVFFVEIQALEEGSSASRRITLSDESTNNRLLIETDESTGAFKFFIAGSGTVRTIATSTGNTQTDINKLAIGYDGVNAKAYINGTQVGSITNATTRTGIDTIDIADWNGTSQVYYGKIKELTVINEALTDEQLQLLTTP